MAEIIVQKQRKLGEIQILVEGWKVPESSEFPEGIKYSYQAYREDTGETLLRYDNSNDSHGARHHKHIGEERTEKLGFRPENRRDLQELFQMFLKEVKRLDET